MMRKVLSDQVVGFIGAGNIAEAVARGFIRTGLIDPGHILMSARTDAKLSKLQRSLGVQVTKDNHEVAKQSHFLFIAVKPGQVADVCKQVAAELNDDTYVISLAAAVPMASMESALQSHARLARAMPNLPCNVREGVVALCPSQSLESDGVMVLSTLLSALGTVVMVDQEEWMDPITALSGSAPAYYVMMADALVQFSIAQGMPEDLSKELILGTLKGSAQWALESKIPLAQLWPKVVTPGGVTEAGMKVFDEKKLIKIFVEGLKQATERAQEVSQSVADEKN